MGRPTDWWVLDLDSDPTPGNPGQVQKLARDFLTFADDANRAQRDVTSLGEDGAVLSWIGKSGDEYRQHFGDLPSDLKKLHTSYDMAGEALKAYWPQLDSAQRQADKALAQGREARERLNSAQSQLESVQDWASRTARQVNQYQDALPSAPPPNPDDVRAATRNAQAAQQRLNQVQSRVNSAESDLANARKLALQAKEMRQQAAEKAGNAIDAASDAGIQNKSFLEEAVDFVVEHWDEFVEACKIVVTVLGIVVLIIGGPLAWLVLAAAAVVLIDTLIKYAQGKASLGAVALAALGCIPGARGLTSLAKLKSLATTVRGAGLGRTISNGLRGLRNLAARFRRTGRDPVDIATGEMVLSQTEVELPGALPLVLSRTHVSSQRVGGYFGPSWSSTLDQRLEVNEAGAYYAADDGMVLVYPLPAHGTSVLPLEGPRWPLARTDDGYTVTDPESGRMLHFAANPAIDETVLPLTAVTDRNDHRIDIDYDVDGVLTQVRYTGGYRVGVDTSGGLVTALRLVGTEDGDQVLVRYGYDADRRLTEVTNSSGQPLRFDYDTDGRITGWRDRNDTWYRYTYDEAGRCVRTSGSGGCMNGTLAYDLDNQVTVMTNSLGYATTSHLNELGQTVREVDPFGNATDSEWDRYDRLLARTDPLRRTTSYTYDADGNLIALTRPDGSQATAEYNKLWLPTTVIDPDGAVWRREYDERGNLLAVTDPVGATTSYDYDERSYLAAVTDPLGNVRRIETNDAGLPVAVTDPLGATTRYTRDAFGRVTAITDPVGGTTRFGWTVEGRPAWRTLPDDATERWAYDGEGNLVEHVDALGQITRTETTHFDLLAAETGPDGARLEFSYDTELRLVAITNPQGLVWRYDHDPAGNLVREADFNGRVLSYSHDAAGQLIERTNGAGQTIRFTRDPLGNVVELQSNDAVATFGYDSFGRIVRASNPDADLTFERDALGRVLAETCNGQTVTSTYDVRGRRLRRRTPSGAESTWEYDVNDQPLALHTAGHTLRFDYDAAGREVERHLVGGAVLAQTWDANHRLREQALTAAGLESGERRSAHQTRLLQYRAYRYRPDGYVQAIDDQLSGPRQLDLDPAGRVTTVRGYRWTERYAYDPAGNITYAEWPALSHDGNADADARGEREYVGTLIRRAGRVRYEHDDEGRVTLRQQKRLSAKPRTWRYTWDADDRLTDVVTPDGQQWRYRYDPFGRRISKQRLGGDGTSVVEEVDFTWDGTVLAEQTYRVPDDNVGRATVWEWEPETFRPVSQTERVPLRDAPQKWIDDQFYAIVTDLVGTPTELIDPDGTLAWNSHPTLWAMTVDRNMGGVSCPLRFPGQYHDLETGLNYNYHRYYDPVKARYESADPLGQDGGANPHTYVLNPMGWTDPLGLAPQRCMENASRHVGPSTPAGKLTPSQQGDLAKFLGLRPYTKRPNKSHGQPVFTDGKRVYSYDVDGHNGGLFKVARDVKSLGSKQTREGTLGLGRPKGTNEPWVLYRVGD